MLLADDSSYHSFSCRTKIENTEQRRSVLRIVRHPRYNPKTKDNDIALLELNREAVLNKNVGLACLPTSPPDPGNSNCYITGTLAFDFGVCLPNAVKPWKNDWTCTEHSLNFSHLVQCVNVTTIFGCGKTTVHCPLNISSVIGSTQLLGWFRLKYACANWTMFNWSGKTTEHLASTSSNKRNLILSTEHF